MPKILGLSENAEANRQAEISRLRSQLETDLVDDQRDFVATANAGLAEPKERLAAARAALDKQVAALAPALRELYAAELGLSQACNAVRRKAQEHATTGSRRFAASLPAVPTYPTGENYQPTTEELSVRAIALTEAMPAKSRLAYQLHEETGLPTAAAPQRLGYERKVMDEAVTRLFGQGLLTEAEMDQLEQQRVLWCPSPAVLREARKKGKPVCWVTRDDQAFTVYVGGFSAKLRPRFEQLIEGWNEQLDQQRWEVANNMTVPVAQVGVQLRRTWRVTDDAREPGRGGGTI